MSRATPDDQVKFLLSCIKFCNNGKIDFVEVARECNVVSKGAAAKRYERLQKAVGYQTSGGSTVTEKATSDTSQRIKKSNKADTGNKRKRDDLSTEICKREGDEETKTRQHLKREKLETPHMQETHMIPRAPTYNPYLHPHPSYMHGPIPQYLHQNMRPTPHYPMMHPQHMPYGNIPNVAANPQFMLPQQALSNFSMAHTIPPTTLHDPNTSPSTYDNLYHTVPLNNNGTDSVLFPNHNPLGTDLSTTFSLPASSSEPEQQVTLTRPAHSDLSLKQECDTDSLPPSFLEYLASDVKTENEPPKQEEGLKTIMNELPENTDGQEDSSAQTVKVCPDGHHSALTTANGEFIVKKEGTSKYLNDCIFISD